MTIETATRRVATYERVSSEDQRERETIKTQRDALDRRLANEASVTLIERYVDEAISGSRKVASRPDGGRLLRDAEAARFTELWVYRLDRLGRDLIDMAAVGRRLRQLGIRLISVVEGEPGTVGRRPTPVPECPWPRAAADGRGGARRARSRRSGFSTSPSTASRTGSALTRSQARAISPSCRC